MKQTARELLLARHTAIAPRLDTLRHSVLADAIPIAASQLLPAIFRPHRRLWLGLAAAWIVILVINLTQPRSPRLDAETIQSLANWSDNQAQLHALLAQTGPDR